MIQRLVLLISSLVLLFGQVPRSQTVCLCTGEVGGIGAKVTDTCSSHALPKCGNCKPASSKGCYVSRGSDVPPVIALDLVSIDCFALIGEPLSIVPYRWQAAPGIPQHLVLPRIREPDLDGHLLRGPPHLA